MARNHSRPNILFILADDMGYGDFSAFNGGLSSTSTLDALMGEGITLSRHYAASPVCNPSRAALLTGRYPHRTGSIDTLDWRGLDRLALREVTLADVLSAAGYTCGLIGKWHLGAFDRRYHPERRGFHESVCFRGGWQDYYRWNLECGDVLRHADGRYLTDVFTEEAVRFIERHHAGPFFLHLTYNAPHDPLQVPEDELRPFVETGRHTKAVSTIYAMIHRIDSGIARILEALRRLRIEENTIVLFTSDNGPQFGGQGDGCHDRFNCDLHGSKGVVYEGGILVPMVMRWPAGLDGNRRVHEMVHFCDWFPTLLAAARTGQPPDLRLDGVDVLPALRGEDGRTETRRFWQWNRYSPVLTSNAAMRDGEWKLVRPAIPETMVIPRHDIVWNSIMRYEPKKIREVIRDPEPERTIPAPPPPELYNTANDPLELEDVAPEHPERVARMLGELESWFEEVEAERATIDDVW